MAGIIHFLADFWKHLQQMDKLEVILQDISLQLGITRREEPHCNGKNLVSSFDKLTSHPHLNWQTSAQVIESPLEITALNMQQGLQ